MSQLWTDEETEILKKLHGKQCSVKQMKEILRGRTENGIRAKLDNLGLGPPEIKPDIDYDRYKALMGVEEV